MISPELSAGTVLQDRYEIVRQISQGGMGRIYLARDLRFKGQHRALKQFLPSQTLDPEQRDQAMAMFEREAGLLASLRHAHMPGVFDHFIEGDVPYLVMHYVEGETLAERLSHSPQGLPERDVLRWAGQLCDILAYLHAQRPPVIFRDLKPANIMVDAAGAVQLIDFGIARLFQGSAARQSDTVIVGTPGYSPPEQYGLQGQTTPRSDVYALGATLYHLLTGIHPGLTPFVFAAPRQVNPAISENTSRAILKALENDPNRRFASAAEFKQALFARETLILPSAPQTEPRAALSAYATLPDVPPPAPPRPPGPPAPVFQYQRAPQPQVRQPAPLPAPSPPAAPSGRVSRVVVSLLLGGALVLVGLVCASAVVVTQYPELLGGLLPPAVTPLAQATEAPSATAPDPTATLPVATSAPAVEETLVPTEVTLSPTPTAAPAARAVVGDIVFVNDYGDAAELYLVRETGGVPARLTNNACGDTEPDWSPDGRIVWQSDCDGSMDLWVMNSNGSAQANLTATAGLDERGADWSPDGLQILFEVGNGVQDGDLFLMDASGGERRGLGLRGRAPAWGPSGSQIAYMAEISGRWTIHIYDLSDGQTRALPCPVEHCRFPEWSPDGLWLAVNDLVEGEPRTIYLLDAAGGGSRQLAGSGLGNGRPAFRPDGERIVFNYDGGDETNGAAIYWMLPDGSSPALIVDLNGDDYQADWR